MMNIIRSSPRAAGAGGPRRRRIFSRSGWAHVLREPWLHPIIVIVIIIIITIIIIIIIVTIIIASIIIITIINDKTIITITTIIKLWLLLLRLS